MSLLYKAISSYIDLKINRERLVSWVDPKGDFLSFIESLEKEVLEGNKKYHLVRFKGSFLESILNLHELMQDTKKPDCLVYIPCISLDDIVKTPFLEVIKSSESITSNTSELIEKISSGYLSHEQLKKCKESLPANFQQLEAILYGDEIDLTIFDNPGSILEFAKSLLSGNNSILDNIENHPKGTLNQIQKGLEKTYGFLPVIINDIFGERDIQNALEKEDHSLFRLPLGAFLMGREYVCDLQNCRASSERLIQLQEQGTSYLNAIQNTLNTLRDQFPDSYKILAKEIEELGLFELEKEERVSKELGNIDTLYFEDTIHQKEVLRLIEIQNYKGASQIIKARSNSFWKKHDHLVAQFWTWTEETVRLAISINETKEKFISLKDLEAILDSYSNELYIIDRWYREFCQSTEHLMQSPNQRYNQISSIRKQIWTEYSDWLITINDHYQFICEKQGFNPNNAKLQQRFYFQNFIKPLIEQGKTAIFFVDAMRYEIGEMLYSKLQESANKPSISAIYAELPTITSVGMNALVPSEMNGSLEPIIEKDKKSIRGFRAGNRSVTSISDRISILKEISKRKIEWVKLEECYRNFNGLKSEFLSSELLVIHSLELDEAGENGFLTKGFDFFEDTTSKIKVSIERLQEMGYENFSVVSDHGFIQYDTGSEHSRSNITIPANFLGSRRYVIQEDKLISKSFSTVEMSKLGYSNSPIDLVFLREPKVFKNAPANNGFFHGGNSLQERIIPVITVKVESKLNSMPQLSNYLINAELFLGKSIHRIELTINSREEGILFKGIQSLLIELENPENGRIRIRNSDAERFENNFFDMFPSKKCYVEFEVINNSENIYVEKSSIRISGSSINSKVIPWVSNVKVPLSSYSYQDSEKSTNVSSNSRNLKIPSGLESDIEIILTDLINSPQGMLNETAITRKFNDPRKSARAIRQFSNFLQNKANELEFTILIDHGLEGKVFKIGSK